MSTFRFKGVNIHENRHDPLHSSFLYTCMCVTFQALNGQSKSVVKVEPSEAKEQKASSIEKENQSTSTSSGAGGACQCDDCKAQPEVRGLCIFICIFADFAC